MSETPSHFPERPFSSTPELINMAREKIRENPDSKTDYLAVIGSLLAQYSGNDLYVESVRNLLEMELGDTIFWNPDLTENQALLLDNLVAEQKQRHQARQAEDERLATMTDEEIQAEIDNNYSDPPARSNDDGDDDFQPPAVYSDRDPNGSL